YAHDTDRRSEAVFRFPSTKGCTFGSGSSLASYGTTSLSDTTSSPRKKAVADWNRIARSRTWAARHFYEAPGTPALRREPASPRLISSALCVAVAVAGSQVPRSLLGDVQLRGEGRGRTGGEPVQQGPPASVSGARGLTP